MADNILYLCLSNGDKIVARLLDEGPEGFLTLDYPMLVENSKGDSGSAVNLVKYFPFTGHNEQKLVINKAHVVSLAQVQAEFGRYFENNWIYQETYIAPQTLSNMIHINKSLESLLSPDNQDFSLALLKYANQLPTVISTKVH